MKTRNRILSGIGALALALGLSVGVPTAAQAGSGSYVTNVGYQTIKVQKWYNGGVYDLGYMQGGSMTAQAVVIPIGQCYKIQRARGYAYGEYCNLHPTKAPRYINVTDYQHWYVYRSR